MEIYLSSRRFSSNTPAPALHRGIQAEAQSPTSSNESSPSCKGRLRYRPSIVKAKMLPVRESFSDITQKSSYKMVVKVKRGALPGYYFSPETRQMFLDFNMYCGSSGYMTTENELPNGNLALILERNNQPLPTPSRISPSSDSPEDYMTGETADGLPRGTKDLYMNNENTDYMEEYNANLKDSTPKNERGLIDRREGGSENVHTEGDSKGGRKDYSMTTAGESYSIRTGIYSISVQEKITPSREGTVVWRPDSRNETYGGTLFGAARSDTALSIKTTSSASLSSPPTIKTTTHTSKEPFKFANQNHSKTPLFTSMSSLSNQKYTMLEDTAGIVKHDDESSTTAIAPPMSRNGAIRSQGTSLQEVLAPNTMDAEKLSTSDMGLYKSIDNPGRHLLRSKLSIQELEELVIEDKSRPTPPAVINSRPKTPLFPGCSGDGQPRRRFAPYALRNATLEDGETSGGFLKRDMEDKLMRARAEVDSVSDAAQARYSPRGTKDFSLQHLSTGCSEGGSSIHPTQSQVPIVDHFKEYMTYFDIDNVTNPPARGFLESNDYSDDSDTASVETIRPSKPTPPPVAIVTPSATGIDTPPPASIEVYPAGTSKCTADVSSTPEGQASNLRRRQIQKKYVFNVPQNLNELLAQAPTAPPNRALPPVPAADEAIKPSGARQPCSSDKVLPTQSTVEVPPESISVLTAEYRDYLNNVNRDESTKIRSKNKPELKVGLELNLQTFMENEGVGAGWMTGERMGWDYKQYTPSTR